MEFKNTRWNNEKKNSTKGFKNLDGISTFVCGQKKCALEKDEILLDGLDKGAVRFCGFE